MLGRGREGGRTPEERAAAAEERARRRGVAPPPMNSMQPPPPLDDEDEFEETPPPVAGVPEAAPELPDADVQAPPPAPAAPPPVVQRRTLPAMPDPAPEPEAEPALPDDEDDGTGVEPAVPDPAPPRLGPRPAPARPEYHTEERDVPDLGPLTPPRRAPEDGRVPDAPRAAPPLRRGRGAGAVLRRRQPGTPPPPRGGRPAGRSGGYRRRRFAAIVVLLVVLVVAFLANKTFQPFHGDPGAPVSVTIDAGSNFSSISNTLAKAGVIGSKSFFSLNATVTGRRGNLHPGHYTLAKDMAFGDVLDALTKGPKAKPPVPQFKVTLAEGESIQEIAKKDTGTTGSYKAAATSKQSLKRAYKLGLPRTQRTTEGFLFPATYDLFRGSSSQALVDAQLKGFADNTSGVDYGYAKKKNLTRYDVLIIASMVEREARLPKDRPLIASVIYNRLAQGIPLGIDATIRYYENNWTEPLKQSELDRDEPYNTRIKRGLPPTPIGNPGLASIQAAAHPAKTGYLFFVVKPCGDGGHVFSKTDAQFERDSARYNAARNAAGGKSPANC